MTNEKITRNRFACRTCGDIIESKHRHDFVSCKCHIESRKKIDSLSEKIMKVVEKNAQRMHIYDETLEQLRRSIRLDLNEHLSTGFYIDGGTDYMRCGGSIEDMINMCEYEEIGDE